MNRLPLAALIVFAAGAAHAECPSPAVKTLQSARQLVVVETPDWNTHAGTMRFWERDLNQAWRPVGRSIAVEVGKDGMGWGFLYANLARPGEPLKHEGDERSPAGVHALGKRFGFDPQPRPGYIPLSANTVCVDDTKSTHYSHIVESDHVKIDWTSGEKMASIINYRSGFDIQYVTSAARRTGSCIFFHIWTDAEIGTSGCAAIDENEMAKAQAWLRDDAQAVLAFLPTPARDRFSACVPGLDGAASSSH